MITRSPINSSNLSGVGYDPATKTLAVEFKNGGIYHYSDVAPEVHAELLKSKSPGGYLHSIKGQYKFEKQDGDPE